MRRWRRRLERAKLGASRALRVFSKKLFGRRGVLLGGSEAGRGTKTGFRLKAPEWRLGRGGVHFAGVWHAVGAPWSDGAGWRRRGRRWAAGRHKSLDERARKTLIPGPRPADRVGGRLRHASALSLKGERERAASALSLAGRGGRRRGSTGSRRSTVGMKRRRRSNSQWSVARRRSAAGRGRAGVDRSG